MSNGNSKSEYILGGHPVYIYIHMYTKTCIYIIHIHTRFPVCPPNRETYIASYDHVPDYVINSGGSATAYSRCHIQCNCTAEMDRESEPQLSEPKDLHNENLSWSSSLTIR